jgi:hypothetical protein
MSGRPRQCPVSPDNVWPGVDPGVFKPLNRCLLSPKLSIAKSGQCLLLSKSPRCLSREARASELIQKVECPLRSNFKYTPRRVDRCHPWRPTDFTRGENQSMIHRDEYPYDWTQEYFIGWSRKGGIWLSLSSLLGFFGFGQNDTNRHKIHYALRLDASKMRFMYPRNKRGSVGTMRIYFPSMLIWTVSFGRQLLLGKEIAPIFYPTIVPTSGYGSSPTWIWFVFQYLTLFGRRSRQSWRAL